MHLNKETYYMTDYTNKNKIMQKIIFSLNRRYLPILPLTRAYKSYPPRLLKMN